MNFNSPLYLLFLPLVVSVYIAAQKREQVRDLWLLAASYFFYMSWDWRYAGLILLSTVVDYLIGFGLCRYDSKSIRRVLLCLSLSINLGMLCLFKYFNFFLDITHDFAKVAGFDISVGTLELLLPVGISFYTFQTLSYTIDLYKNQIDHERNFVKFAVFVSFFPQLVAGPIVRARDFLPQLHSAPSLGRDQFNSALILIFRGLFKKVIIADLLASLAIDSVFKSPSSFSTVDLYFALVGYAFQIYNDFSGYSDIAIGSAKLLGFDLPKNFDRPYLAESVRDFWSRWHISLSTWLRDYLYIPLGGSRLGQERTCFNLLVTMLLGGLWHGAAINFVLWGAYHGILLVFSHTIGHRLRFLPWIALRRLICFNLILFGWLLFRSDNYQVFSSYCLGLVQFSVGTQFSLHYWMVLLIAFSIHYYLPVKWSDDFTLALSRVSNPVLGSVFGVAVLVLWGCTLGTPNFIYFQF